VLSFPLALRIGSAVPNGTGDLWQNLWNFWWWRRALLELGTSPFWTDAQFHPGGVSLAFHTHSPLNVLATLPLQPLVGIEGAYVVALLAGFLLAALGSYLLVRDLSGEPRAAFLAGLIFAFAPMHFEQSLEHLNLSSVQFLPFCVLFLRRLVRDGGAANVVAAALAFAANALVCWQYGVLALPIALALAGREAIARPRPPARLAGELAIASGLAAVLVLPFAWPMLRELAAGVELGPKRFEHRGTDLAFWLLPSDHHPILGGLTEGLYATRRSYPNAGFLTYLGFVPLGLALLALVSPRYGGDRRGFWGVWLGGFLLLSLGAHPMWLGRVYDGIVLPHALFEHVPGLGLFRVANRFALVALLGLTVLAGASLATLFREGRTRLAWLLGALLVFEYLWLPYPTRPAAPHPYLAELAADPATGAVLPIPLPIQAGFSEALYDQTRHGQPIVGGYVSYRPPSALDSIERSPFLRSLVRHATLAPVDRGELAELGIGTVLVHLDRRPARRRRARLAQAGSGDAVDPWLLTVSAELERALGPPAYSDERLLVFRVPGGPPVPR
jgi:hypothetical protein